MSLPTTYALLTAAIINVADDASADLATVTDTIIALAETRVLRDLDLEIFQQQVTGNSLTAHNRVFTRPTGVVKINGLWLVSTGTTRKFIPQRTKGYCEMWSEDSSLEAFPSYWAEQDTTSLMFVKTPDAAYAVVIYGIKRPTGLSGANTTTWLSTYAADLLLKACLIECEEYLTNPDQATVWKNEYLNELLPKAKFELRGLSRATYENPRFVAPATVPL